MTSSLVAVSQPVLNRSPKLWGDDAEDFKPERFDRAGFSLDLVQSKAFGCPGAAMAGKGTDAPPHAFGFVPFGAGRRTCIGQRLAMMESVQIMASIVKNFRVELSEDHHPAPEHKVVEVADISLGPKEGLFLKLSRW